IKKYMMGADVKTDWKVGSPLVYTGSYQGKKFEEKGVIRRIEPKKLLEATHFSTTSGKEDKPENYHLVTWHLQDQGKSTVLAVTQNGIANAQGVEGAKKNWQAVLETLKKVVESG
ncbi:MAG TPA: SRPBCC family protein, partial [Polyangiaceae bacterium]